MGVTDIHACMHVHYHHACMSITIMHDGNGQTYMAVTGIHACMHVCLLPSCMMVTDIHACKTTALYCICVSLNEDKHLFLVKYYRDGNGSIALSIDSIGLFLLYNSVVVILARFIFGSSTVRRPS